MPLVSQKTFYMDGEVHGSVYSYAFTKRLLLRGIQAYNDQYGLNGSYLIPATMFGEYDDFNPRTVHVCGALIGKFVCAAKEGLPEVEIWGDGTQVRDFLDVKEFVRATLNLATCCDRDIINIGPGHGTSIRDLAETICRASGFQGKVVYNAARYVGIREKFIDCSRLAEKYNWRITSDLESSLSRTVRWYAGNYESVKDQVKFPELA